MLILFKTTKISLALTQNGLMKADLNRHTIYDMGFLCINYDVREDYISRLFLYQIATEPFLLSLSFPTTKERIVPRRNTFIRI